MSLNSDHRAAFAKLSKLRAGALFMKMGTGKTKVACDLVRDKLAYIDAVIWIAPACLVNSEIYLDEIRKWGSDFFPITKFFSVEGISKSDAKYFKMRRLAESSRNYCVVDESIYIKNASALRTRRLMADCSLFDFRLILNGTPVTRSLLDLYSQMSFLSPKILNMTERQFADKFLVYMRGAGMGERPWAKWSKPANVEALAEIIRPYVFGSPFDYPCSVREHNIFFALDCAERARYSEYKERFLFGKRFVNFLAVAQKFQMAYTVGCKEKFSRALSIVDEALARGEKVVVFVKYAVEARMLGDALGAVVYTGRRKDDLAEFFDTAGVLVCTYGVGSCGLNLQCANNVIFFSQTFDYKDKEQAKHRICRTGQSRQVNVYDMWVKTGLEKMIKDSLERKEHLLHSVDRIITAEKARKL